MQVFARNPSDFCTSLLALIRSRWLGGTALFTAATIGPPLLILGAASEAQAQACIGSPVQTNQTCTNSTTLTNTSTDGSAVIGLQDAGTLTLTNTSSGTITGTDRGVQAATTANVSNAGTIQGTAADSRGISAGTVNVTANTGTISGGFRGIRADTATVTNSGTIQAIGADGSGIFTSDSATVTNSGAILGPGNGILSLNTANVTNLGTGTIGGTTTGSFGINTGSTVVGNAGLIFGLAGGINATTTADVTNSGTIQGTAASSFGISADSIILKNTGLGLISGVAQGLNIATTANVTNSGTIQATSATGFGILADTATVTNSGTISGGSRGISAQTANVTNELSGTISGGSRGVRAVTANVTNYGLIQGTDAGSAGLFAATTVGVTNYGTIQSLGSNGFGIQSLGAVTGTNYATIQGAAAGSLGIDAASVDMTNSGTISGVGGGINATATVNMTNSHIIQGTGSNSFGIQAASAVVTNSGTISGAAKGIAVTGTVNVTNTSTGFISGAERGIEATNAGNTAATVSNAGIIQGTAADSRGIAADSVTVTSNTGTISGGFRGIRATTANVTNLSSGTIQATGANGSGIFVFDTATVTNSGFITGPANGIQSINSANVTNSGIISGLMGINVAGASSVTNSGTITGSGGTAILFGATGNTLTLAPGSIINGTAHGFGADTFQLGGTGSDALDAGLFATQFSGYTTFNKIGASTWTLTGTNAAALPWTISGGTLLVDATLSNSAMTVTAGGTLGGAGTVGTTAINGGALAPGHAGIGTLNVQGSLTFTTAAAYLVQVSSTASDLTTVAGAATLAGTVQVTSPTNSYRFNSPYTILTSASLGGTQFNTLSLPAGITGINGSITYLGGTTVLLNLTSVLGTLPGLNGNQRTVGNALDTALNAGGALGSLNAIFTGNIAQNLTQVSGELATGSQQATFNAMNQFLGVITDPFITGRGDPLSGGGSPNAYADQTMAYAAKGKGRSASERDAYAAVYSKAPPLAPSFAQRWSVWAAGFGGSQRTDGNAFVGSNDTRSSLYGVAVGADYRLSPNTIAGFALAGGGTSFSVNNLGSGRSDLFQAGGFIRHNVGAAYLTGALAYGWQDITTDRTVTVAGLDQLHARFSANAWSGRLEGGYRLAGQGFGITPYAAGQFTTFELPNYVEQAVVGANTFALTYNAKSVTDTRSELGIRTDKSFAMADGILTLRGRFAWAHDFNPDRNIAATFLALPGASFVVNGAAMAPDAALVTAALEKKWLNGWSAAATFEGEFSNVTTSYAGKGIVRYVW